MFANLLSMKKQFLHKIKHLLLVALVSSSTFSAYSQSYEIKVQIKDFPDTVAYLSYFYGAGQFYRDTAAVDPQGNFVFSDQDTLEHGMYSVIVKNRKLFDFLVDEQKMSFQSDTLNLVANMKTKGSHESKIFFEYLKFLDAKNKEVKAIRKELSDLETNSEAYNSKQEEVQKIDGEVKSFIASFHEKYPKSLSSNFIYALEYPTVPEPPKDENGMVDSTFGFRYFKAHFFDNFAWEDERLLRTSTFHEKMEYYIEKLTLQDADSVIKSVDYILSNVENTPATYKYTLSYLTSKYERSQVMGMDAVFVHLAKEYFIKRRPEWFTDNNLKKLVERANALDPLLIGKKAPNIIVKDTAMKEFIQLYDIKAKYTIVYIWSPECGHCKVATPQLKEVYDRYKSKGVEVFGIGNEFENEEWKEFIRKHDLNWINGSDGGDFRSNFRGLYDVYSTPQTYLLDENKKILSKKMSVESLEKMLEYYLKKDEKNKVDQGK